MEEVANNIFESITLDDEKLNNTIIKYDIKNKHDLVEFEIPSKYISKKGKEKIFTKIGKELFKNCEKLTKITLPDTIEKIAQQSFFNCKNLQEINIPANVKIIGTASFCGCEILKTVILQEGLKEIKAFAFAHCPNIKTIVVPDSVTNIDDYAFEGIENIKYNGSLAGSPWGAKSINGKTICNTI